MNNSLLSAFVNNRRQAWKTMEWIIQNWFIVILGLVALAFLFVNKSKRSQKGTVHASQHGTDSGQETHKSGGCCH
jgi:hypothetical protein